MNTTNTALLTRLDLLEREIADIRKKLISDDSPSAASLRGIWKDIEVTDEDIRDLKPSPLRDVDDTGFAER